MAQHHADRLRLLALLVAIIARSVALAIVTVLALNFLLDGDFDRYRPARLAAWLGLSAAPALILSPFVGPFAGSRWNRTLLVGGALAVVLVLAWAWAIFDSDLPLISIAGFLSLEAALFWTAVIALVPSVAAGVRWPRPTVWMLLVISGAFGLHAGVHLGLSSHAPKAELVRYGLIAGVVALIGVALANFAPAEPLSIAQGIVRPFVVGARDAIRHHMARLALIGLWLWFFVAVTVVVGVTRLASERGGAGALTDRFYVAVAAGALLTAIHRNPHRHGGFVFYAALAVLTFSIWLCFGASASAPVMGLGVALGAAMSPLLTVYQTWTTPKYHGPAAALAIAGWSVSALIFAAILMNLGEDPSAARQPLLVILLVVSGVAVLGALLAFFRPALELTAEVMIAPFYRIEVVGPGVDNLPARGPCLVIANHAAWFDPLFLAKVLPAAITPMMTSRFYDLPVLSWIMRNVIGTIRVPEKAVRHDAPELKEAVAALDRGACVVLFPEGYLRRKEEQPIRRFGRGVWQILHDRPDTPVFACWIEGNWGSYFSYKGGPPTKNKRFDFWRRIRISITGPVKVDPALLEDHMATRTYLMQQVAAARAPLGLEPLAVESAPDEEKE